MGCAARGEILGERVVLLLSGTRRSLYRTELDILTTLTYQQNGTVIFPPLNFTKQAD